MFYMASDYEKTQDIIYNVKKINYVTRKENKVKIFYDNWSNKVKFNSNEEALRFMAEIHKILNKKSFLRKLFDLII